MSATTLSPASSAFTAPRADRAQLLARLAPSTAALVTASLYYGTLALALFAGIDLPAPALLVAYLLPVAAHLGRLGAGRPAPKESKRI